MENEMGSANCNDVSEWVSESDRESNLFTVHAGELGPRGRGRGKLGPRQQLAQ